MQTEKQVKSQTDNIKQMDKNTNEQTTASSESTTTK